MKIERYSSLYESEWNCFVRNAKNATFLFDRQYMDYHSDRFVDCSLMFRCKGRLKACLPANWNIRERSVCSHGGLTYGGLIIDSSATLVEVLKMFRLASDYFKTELGAESWIYKPLPYIYNTSPAQEDLYALFRMEAKLIARGVSSAIPLSHYNIRGNRLSGVKKAVREGLEVEKSSDIKTFWHILDSVLKKRHGVTPVHTCSELELLMSRFPENIGYFAVKNKYGKMYAGCLVYDMGKTIHTQYMASNDEGRKSGALDLLIYTLVNDIFADREFFDFGISTESCGKYLNEGLIFQKEGFGGQAVCYDAYRIDL